MCPCCAIGVGRGIHNFDVPIRHTSYTSVASLAASQSGCSLSIDSAGGHSHLLLTLRWNGRRIGSIRRLQWWLIRRNNCLRIISSFPGRIRIQRKTPLDTVYRTGIVFHDIINHLLSPSYQCFFTPFEALTIIIRDSKVNHQHFEILRNYPIKERDRINLSRFQFYAAFRHGTGFIFK